MIQETITYTCYSCDSINIVKNGTNKCGNQQYHCKDCGAYRVLKPENQKEHPNRTKILHAYRERVSLRGLERIFGVCRKIDLDYTNFAYFRQLTEKGVTFITRAKSNLKYEVAQVLVRTPVFRDTIIWIGSGADRQQVRLVEVLYGNKWLSYLTNELDPEQLLARYLVALYYRRWTIERAYATVKRLLGLDYFWCGFQNAVELQLWSTWIVYTVLIDLCDEVAGLLKLPFERISVEMVFRSTYYYTKAVERGDTRPLAEYLADRSADLGIVRRKRKNQTSVFELWPLTIASNP